MSRKNSVTILVTVTAVCARLSGLGIVLIFNNLGMAGEIPEDHKERGPCGGGMFKSSQLQGVRVWHRTKSGMGSDRRIQKETPSAGPQGWHALVGLWGHRNVPSWLLGNLQHGSGHQKGCCGQDWPPPRASRPTSDVWNWRGAECGRPPNCFHELASGRELTG
jgi:hypothetical protein